MEADLDFLQCRYVDEPLEELRAQKFPWKLYCQNGFLSESQCDVLSSAMGPQDFEGSHISVLLEAFLRSNQTEVLKYLLALLHDKFLVDTSVFQNIDHALIKNFKDRLISMLTSIDDGWFSLLILKVLALFYAFIASNELKEESKSLSVFISAIERIIQSDESERMVCAIQVLAFLLQHFRPFRRILVERASSLFFSLRTALLREGLHFQIQYSCLFCFWLLTFDAEIAATLKEYDLIPIIAEICRNSNKEKVIRVCFAIFRNLLEKACTENISIMIGCKILELTMSLESRKFSDEEIAVDVQFVKEILDRVFQGLSTFDEYASEIRSGLLFWTPAHKSEAFWKQNVHELDSNNHEILRRLISLAGDANVSPIVRAISVHDLGQYVKYNPRGRRFLDEFGGKTNMMLLISAPESEVNYEALTALQKYMVNRW